MLDLPSGKVTLSAGDYEITSEDMPGHLVASEGTLTLALDIVQTPQLIREGNARELIHPVQNLRKKCGLDVTDRISTSIYADGAVYDAVADALGEYSEYVSAQTLSTSLELKSLSEKPEEAAEVEWGEGNIYINIVRNNS